jgi:hypothetical protein
VPSLHIDFEVDGLDIGGSLVGHMALKTHQTVAISSVSSPDRIFTKASRCLESARSSAITC